MFSERLSYGFLKYLHMLRVEHAKNLLRNSRLKMSEVLVQSGFSDQKTFNRVFREVTGMTPTDYRNITEKTGAV
jgi:two-component system response regulator YesN